MLSKNELETTKKCMDIACYKCPINEKQLTIHNCCVGIISKSHLEALEQIEQLQTENKSLKRQLSFLNIK